MKQRGRAHGTRSINQTLHRRNKVKESVGSAMEAMDTDERGDSGWQTVPDKKRNKESSPSEKSPVVRAKHAVSGQ